MSDPADRPTPGGRPPWTRRQWLAVTSLLGLYLCEARADPPAPADALAAARDRATEAGIVPLRASRTDHYAAVGDAPDAYQAEALQICEKLAVAYGDHMKAKGMPVRWPAGKLAVVTLAGRNSYEKFKGEASAKSEGGYYDLGTNRLVVFDFRTTGAPAVGDAQRTNSVTLTHEAMHQLTFNSGLLSRDNDVPIAVSEGLATYGELAPIKKPTLGQINKPRLAILKDRPAWIPVESLLTNDELFNDPETEQVAYLESWLLVYHLMKAEPGRTSFRKYLDAIRTRTDETSRAADAAAAFGPLAKLDATLKQAVKTLR